MSYVPNPYNTLQPTDDVFAGTAAAEFRAMKIALLGIGAGASYRGEWATFVAPVGAQPADQGDTFTHNNAMWMLKAAVADVGAIPPSSADTANWFKMYPTALVVDSVNGGQLAGFRNKVLNGKMEVHQLGAAVAIPASSAIYTLDQWVVSNLTAAALTATREASPLATSGFTKCHRLTVTTADASIAAADNCVQYQPIEGREIVDLIDKTFTVQFRVKSPKTGTHCVILRNGANNLSYVAEYTVNAANTWEKKTFTVVGGLPSSGTWDVDSATGLLLGFTLAAGTTHQTAPDSWSVGSFAGTANQVNCLDTIGNVFETTGIQVEIGDQATPFEQRPFTTELLFCQRYYAYLPRVLASGYNAAGQPVYAVVRHSVVMRDNPAITFASLSYSNSTNLIVNETNTYLFRIVYTVVATGTSFAQTDCVVSARL